MRPLYHPPLEEITVQGILYALSDIVRVRIFLQLSRADCAKNCSAFLNIIDTPLPKSTLSQHFKILREAGLIRSERKGVELRNQTRCEELRDSFGTMINAILQTYIQRGLRKKNARCRASNLGKSSSRTS
jgi:DNA-binding transcriptional ArsR family regulator